MRSASVVRPEIVARPALVRTLSATEAKRAFHDRVLDLIREFLDDHAMQGKTGAREFYEFEKTLHERLLEAEREIVGDVMAGSDVDADAIKIEGRVHRRVLRSRQAYMTACGEVEVERWLYKDRADPTAHALAALDHQLGIVEGFWTQRAAERASWVVTQMKPGKAEDLFERVGNPAPSKSRLDRLPKALGERWEAQRELYEQVLRKAIVVPEQARSVAVSIDGVLAPVDGGASPTEVRASAARAGRVSKGPVLRYFRKNKQRMRYAEWKSQGYMIGSGLVEAACKTLVAQRLKLSGMRRGAHGAQAILIMRGWDQSERSDEAWALVAATYHCEVHMLANVVAPTPRPDKERRKRTSR